MSRCLLGFHVKGVRPGRRAEMFNAPMFDVRLTHVDLPPSPLFRLIHVHSGGRTWAASDKMFVHHPAVRKNETITVLIEALTLPDMEPVSVVLGIWADVIESSLTGGN